MLSNQQLRSKHGDRKVVTRILIDIYGYTPDIANQMVLNPNINLELKGITLIYGKNKRLKFKKD